MEVIGVLTLAELVEPYGLTVDEFTDQLRGELAAHVQADPRALTAAERGVLQSIGVAPADLDAPLAAGDVVTTAAHVLAATADMLTTDAMAHALDRSESRVRGAIADGSLAAVRVGRTWRLPAWQMEAGRPIPHLRKIIVAKPDDVSWALVGRVMTSPTDELYVDGHAVSPRTWLLDGGDPRSVVSIISMLLAW